MIENKIVALEVSENTMKVFDKLKAFVRSKKIGISDEAIERMVRGSSKR